jgi:hypothetical protein
MVGGGQAAIIENLRTMATESASKFTYEEMMDAIKKRIHKIKLPYIGEFKVNNTKRVKVNPEAYGGFISSLVCGETRRESHAFNVRVSTYLLRKVKKARVSALYLWKFGTRPKANNLDNNGKILRARPIALCDGVLNLLVGVFSQDITMRLKFLDYNELFIGKALNRKDYEYLVENLDKEGMFNASPD